MDWGVVIRIKIILNILDLKYNETKYDYAQHINRFPKQQSKGFEGESKRPK
jgi:hypothetical protein